MKFLGNIWSLLKETFNEFMKSSASKDSASIAYYAIFSLPGLLIIVIWVAGNFFGEHAIQGEVTNQFRGLMGKDVAQSVQGILASAVLDKQNIWMKVLGIGTLVFGATTLFFQMQSALNNLWDIESAPKIAWQKFLLDRATSLGMILIITFLLLVSMMLSSMLGLANNLITNYFGLQAYVLMQATNFILGFAVVALLFALMFKVLPDIEISWRSVWMGSIVTATLFNIGKMLLSFYFEYSKPTTVFGAAGTIILLMMWINYSCQLILFGAEFTKVYANRNGYKIKPSKFAKWTAAKILKDQQSETPTENPS